MKKPILVLSIAVVTAACSSNTGGSSPAAGQAPEGSTAVAPATAGAAAPAGGTDVAGHPSRSSAASAEAAVARTAPAAAAEPAKPKFKEVTVPPGTTLSLKLQTDVASDTSKAEDKVRATLNKPLVVDGTTAVPAGAEVLGSVLTAQESGRVKGRAAVAFQFEHLHAWKESYDIQTARIAREAEATKGEDAKKIGIGAGAGAAIGAIAGGKKGAGIGALVGGGAGTGVVMATKGEEVRLAAGTVVSTTLAQALKVNVPIGQ